MSKKQPAEDPAHIGSTDASLERAIGRQVKHFRTQLNMTVADVSKQAQISQGMWSKIENGLTSPSLGTLNAIANALNVPVTALFRRFEEQQRDVTMVKSGEGLTIERRGTRAGHQYQLLGHTVGRPYSVEPYIISITNASEVFPVFEHEGMELIYVLEGSVGYRHGGTIYKLEPGDSLFFDAIAPHGPEELEKLPIRLLSVIVSMSDKP
ncbi:MAG: XRE family transcriptional regulator [Pseudomonadota bacterium]